ncbi:hypothetical protein FS837_011444 [Tulasnella sp. UAMH 9824]|nr:hypothetical protein FS837_011444 [Tulasnella sp. UAMH 9824]
MSTAGYAVIEEAIGELLQRHTNTSIDDVEQRETESQYQRLKRESDALESELKILKAAKKATDEACDLEPLSRRQDPTSAAELGYRRIRDPRLRRQWRVKVVSASQENVAARDHILQWSQKTIESVIQGLIQEQIEAASEGPDKEFTPPWSSPSVMGPVFLSGRLQKRISSLGEQLADVRWRQNALLPIARLPSEILIKVFAFVLRVKRLDDDTHILGAVLTRICREWTRLIDNTPSLWTRISPYKSTFKHVIMALEKSQTLPVDLYFDEDHMRQMPLNRFFGATKRHKDRWRVLEVILCSSYKTLNSQISKVSTPQLEKLVVSMELQGYAQVYDTTPYEINFIKGAWPGTLRHLCLSCIGVPHGSFTQLRGLKSLEIYQLPPGKELSMAEVFYALANCPELEKLLLRIGSRLQERSIFQTTPGYPSLPVRLDRLQELSLLLCPAPLHTFLRNIRTINCTKFNITPAVSFRDELAWTEVLLTAEIQPFVDVMESVLLSASAISIAFGEGSVSLDTETQNSKYGVCLRFVGGHSSEVGRWMAESLALGPAEVTVTFSGLDTTWVDATPFILSKFQNIVNLTFYGADSIGQHAIDFLGIPLYTDLAGYSHFPLPRLSYLVVVSDYLPNVISMAERRYGPHGPTDITSTRGPVPLTRLHLLWGTGRVVSEDTLVQQLALALPECKVERS